uniref:C2H2-type domain-containing protein n=1 Tax=Ditylenchus dipsaci TaxID=166011 RepID=A0A915DYU8_9BILA
MWDCKIMSLELIPAGIVLDELQDTFFKTLSMKSPRTYNCPKCPKTFPWPRNVRKHVESMHSKRHKCPEANCDEAFDTQHDLRRHSSVEHPKFRTCEYCPYKHRKPAMVRRHREQFHGDNAVSCSVEGCGMIMPYRKIKSHVQEKHSDVLYPLKATTSTTPEVMLFESEETHCQCTREALRTKKRDWKIICLPGRGVRLQLQDAGDLDDHLNTQVHKSEYPFECGIVPKSFLKEASMPSICAMMDARSMLDLIEGYSSDEDTEQQAVLEVNQLACNRSCRQGNGSAQSRRRLDTDNGGAVQDKPEKKSGRNDGVCLPIISRDQLYAKWLHGDRPESKRIEYVKADRNILAVVEDFETEM